MKLFRCKKCGQIVQVIKNTDVPLYCCGEVMEEVIPKENEAEFKEKHVPIYLIKKDKAIAKIGMIPHPMTNDHFIEWIALATNKGYQKKCLKPGNSPKAVFNLDDDEEVEAIYAYCNIHSLWKLDVRRTTNKKKECGCSIKGL